MVDSCLPFAAIPTPLGSRGITARISIGHEAGPLPLTGDTGKHHLSMVCVPLGIRKERSILGLCRPAPHLEHLPLQPAVDSPPGAQGLDPVFFQAVTVDRYRARRRTGQEPGQDTFALMGW